MKIYYNNQKKKFTFLFFLNNSIKNQCFKISTQGRLLTNIL